MHRNTPLGVVAKQTIGAAIRKYKQSEGNFATASRRESDPCLSRTPAPQPGLRAYKRTLLGPRSQNRRRTSGWELESQIRRAPGRGETPRPLVWVKLGTALAPSVISLRSTIEVRSPASLEAARPSPDRPLT